MLCFRNEVKTYHHTLNAIIFFFYQFCTRWDDSSFPGVAISPVQFEVTEDDDKLKEISVNLQTAPNLTKDVGYDPYLDGENKVVAEITFTEEKKRVLFYPPTIRFTVSSWSVAQSVYVTVVDDEIFDPSTDEHGFYYLFPKIDIRSPDAVYFNLEEERKSILGQFAIKVLENEEKPQDIAVVAKKKSFGERFIAFFEENTLFAGIGGGVLFLLCVGYGLNRCRKKRNAARREIRRQEMELKHDKREQRQEMYAELEKENEQDMLLE